MATVQFATCSHNDAIRFLKKGYTNKLFNRETLPKFWDALTKDIFRVTDPDFHQLALVTGKNYKDEHRQLMNEIQTEINNCPSERSV